MSEMTHQLVKWAAEEVERQRDTPIHVSHMLAATQWAENNMTHTPWRETQITKLGSIVKPSVNYGYFREINVTIGGTIPLPDYNRVPRLMNLLLTSDLYSEPDEFYRHFEEIHPFEDGNGRVGSILWNLLEGYLAPPYDLIQTPPDFWNEYGWYGLESLEEREESRINSEVIQKEIEIEGPD